LRERAGAGAAFFAFDEGCDQGLVLGGLLLIAADEIAHVVAGGGILAGLKALENPIAHGVGDGDVNGCHGGRSLGGWQILA